MGWRYVTQLAQRCPYLVERGAIPLAFHAVAGINASGPGRVTVSFDDAVSL
jgi:hypothetical protein